ncbi:MAG: molecular chaperone [Candidatus Krumholzibacteriia bacterium]
MKTSHSERALRVEADEALSRSMLYGTLSLGLHAPTAEIVGRLQSMRVANAILEAARFLESGDAQAREAAGDGAGDDRAAGSTDDFPRLAHRVRELTTTLSSVELDSLQALYGSLFGHTTRGRVCPYEAEFGSDSPFQQTERLANLAGFYEAFGLIPSSLERERVDHIGCELEFLEFLSRKEAYALSPLDADMLRETRKATRLFLRDHLGRFGRAFARMLAREDPEGLYGKLADMLFDFITMECRRVGVPAGPSYLRLRSTQEDALPMQCSVGCGSECEVSDDSIGET